jgi:two-component system OmpR family sensor kinase
MRAVASPLRSLRNRLALIFFSVTLLAIAAIYAYVISGLQNSLRDEKLRTLSKAAQAYSGPISKTVGANVDPTTINKAVRQAADRSNTFVSLLQVSAGTEGVQTRVLTLTSKADDFRSLKLPVARLAARSGRLETAIEASRGGRIGEAAKPLLYKRKVAQVVVYSSRLSDVAANTAVIRRRILVAGGISLIIAVLAGLIISGRIARRLRRLERAAGHVAAGDFSEPLPVDSDDELGQLARAFNEMQARLAQLDSARKSFIATASHELRTPIFSLGGFAELLEDEDVDPETRRHFVAEMRQQTARLAKLTTELLDLSRLDAGELELRPEETDISELARSVSREFIPALAQHDSNLELRLAGGPIEAVCDAERVAQIMRILIDNALSHTPEGTGIFVSAARANGSVRLAVRDDGPGIKSTALKEIFEPFYTSDDARGSGLGLAIARELAGRMDGRLDVASEAGRTVFTLELPT